MLLIVDLDGTVADNRHREMYIPTDKSRTEHWDSFNTRCDQDAPVEPIVALIHWYMASTPMSRLLFATSRTETARTQTEDFLRRYFGQYDYQLIMRPVGDHRSATAIKAEWFDALAPEVTSDAVFIEDNHEVHQLAKQMYPLASHLLVPSLDCAYKPTSGASS